MVELQYKNRQFLFNEGIDGNVIRTLGKGRFYEPGMLKFIEKLEPEGTIIDVGANIGNHAIYLGAFTDCQKVIAIEPHPGINQHLTDNVEQNGLASKIDVHHIAVGDKAGKCNIESNSERYRGTAQVLPDSQGSIPIKKLDNLAQKRKVSVIKIDVEGFEPQVLRGSSNILSRQEPHIFVEAHDRKAKRQIDEILHPLGYKAVKVFNRTPTYYYRKDASRTGIKELIQRPLFHLRRLRIFRILG
ncbi:hypothetical protein BRC19_00795 [Candidatus Saccharibacteria bacterium QS_5_54_17]|nr:MAG: hypothetical protein BRC19_00795 [Candidatus Saccharibacteria bacterium QS_5_54_17]